MSQLFFKQGAGWSWEKALPIGNGSLGAMIYSPENFEHYQLNEDSVWFGGPRNRNNKDALVNLTKVRELILDGKISESEELLKYAFSGTPQSQHPYQTLGDVYIDFCGKNEIPIHYERKLCLDTAIHYVTSTEETTNVTYTREAFASAVDDCIVTNIRADKEGALDMAASLQRMSFYEATEHTKDALYITGNLGGGGMDFCCGIKFISGEGELSGLGEHLICKKTTNIIVLITALTTYRVKNPRLEVEKRLNRVAKKSYEQLKEDHIKEYQSYFKRMKLELDYDKVLDKMTTDERLERINEKNTDNGFISTYFDFGRYLLISSSRGDCLPANLQGIWNKDIDPAWGSKYTININTEMNYWPAGMCNLSDCQEPLFEHLLRMREMGNEQPKRCMAVVDLWHTIIQIYGAIQLRKIFTFLLPIGSWGERGFVHIFGNIMNSRKTLRF